MNTDILLFSIGVDHLSVAPEFLKYIIRYQSADILPQHPADFNLAIICSTQSTEDVISLERTLTAAGIFVIHITSLNLSDSKSPVCHTNPDLINNAINNLLSIALANCGPITLDVNDIISALRGIRTFRIEKLTFPYDDTLKEGRLVPIINRYNPSNDIKSLIILVSFNPSISNPLTMEEITPLSSFIRGLSSDCMVVWSLTHSSSLPKSGQGSITITFLSAT